MLHGLISYPGLTMNQVPTTRFLFSHKNLDRQTSLFPEPLCLPSETFKLSSLDPSGSAKSAENRTENQRKHEQSSAFGGGGLGAVWGRGVGAPG